MRRWIIPCAALALALSLAACGREEPSPEPTASPEPTPARTAPPETAATPETAGPELPDLGALAELAGQAAAELPELPDAAELQTGLEELLNGQGSGTGWDTDLYWIACLDDSAYTLHIGADGFDLTRYWLDETDAVQVRELAGMPVLDGSGLSVVDDTGAPVLQLDWSLLAEDGDGLPRLDLDARDSSALPEEALSFYMTTAANAGEAETMARSYLENRQEPTPGTDDMTTLLAGYRGVSIVDACILNGLDPALENRAVYAEYFGIENYRGTPEQNLYLLTCMGGVIE